MMHTFTTYFAGWSVRAAAAISITQIEINSQLLECGALEQNSLICIGALMSDFRLNPI